MFRLHNAYKTPDSMDYDPDEIFTCPYDANHKIRAKRYPYHIQACRKNHPLSNKVTCPFNARHVIPAPEYKYHLTICPDKRVIEQDLEYALQKQHGVENSFKGCTDVPAYDTYVPPPSSENWDEDINDDQNYEYNPPENYSQPIYKNTCGMTPAEKRAHREYLFRQEERRKAGLPPEQDNFEGCSMESLPALAQVPLRLPREPAKAYQQGNQMALGGDNSRLGLSGLGRGLLMNRYLQMANQEENAKKSEQVDAKTTQGFGRGMAANFSSVANQSNGHATASEAKSFVKMLGRGRGGTPQTRNRQRTQAVGGLAGQTKQSSNNISIPQSPNKQINEEKPQVQASSVDSSSSLEESEEVIRKKLMRKLTKKLNGIKLLEKNRDEGKILTEEEEQKIRKRAEVEKQLEVLSQLEN